MDAGADAQSLELLDKRIPSNTQLFGDQSENKQMPGMTGMIGCLRGQLEFFDLREGLEIASGDLTAPLVKGLGLAELRDTKSRQ